MPRTAREARNAAALALVGFALMLSGCALLPELPQTPIVERYWPNNLPDHRPEHVCEKDHHKVRVKKIEFKFDFKIKWECLEKRHGW